MYGKSSSSSLVSNETCNEKYEIKINDFNLNLDGEF